MTEPSNDKIPADEMAFAREQARIGAENKAFAKASLADQRVAIAKDVLAWLKLGKLKAKKGTYLETNTNDVSLIAADGETCTACALGAIFACAAAKANAVSFTKIDRFNLCEYVPCSSWDMHDLLAPYFTRDELKNIENAFEGKDRDGWLVHAECDFEPGNFSEAAVVFNKGIRSHRERMERIMRNIVRNGGDFRP